MKVLSWRVDGFGVFTGTQVNDVGPGLTIVHGRNESGKTTLVDFLCGVLFGYPDRRRKIAQHEPLAGGRHGGSVELLGDDGTRMRVERHVGARDAVITVAGAPRSAADLRRLLGGADEGLFRSTFAFGLDELRSLDTLEQDEVRDLIYSAGVLGAGQRATAALRTLDERRARIVRARRADARANHLAQQLEDVEQVLREARRRAANFPEMQAELDRRAEAMHDLAGQLELLGVRRRELDRLLAAWPVWNRGHLAAEELESLIAETDAERDRETLAARPAIAELRSALASHEARAEQRGALERSRSSLSESVSNELALLGGAWDLERILAADCSLGALASVRSHEAALDEALSAVKVQAERASVASDGHARAADARDGTAPTRPIEEIERDRARVRACRSLLAEEVRLRGEVRTDALARRIEHEAIDAGRRRQAGDARRGTIAALCCALVVLAAIAVLGMVNRQVILSIGAIAAMGLVGGVAGLIARGERPQRPARHRAGVSSRRHEAEPGQTGPVTGAEARTGAPEKRLDQDLAAVQTRLHALVDALCLEPPLVDADLDRLDEQLESERDHCTARQRATAEFAHTIRALESETTVLRSRESALRAAAAAWADWKAEVGLADLRNPSDVLEVLGLVASAKGHAAAIDRVEHEIVRHSASSGELDEATEQLRGLLGDVANPSMLGPGPILELLDRRIEAGEQRSRRAGSLNELCSGSERELTDMLGARGSALRLAVAVGDVAAWEAEQAELQSQIAALAASYEAAVREHQDQARQIDAIAVSDHIARVEIERTRLAAELRSELADWLILTLARTLVAGTLENYERDRQPAVVERAADLFGEVTSGRYVRLVPRGTPGGSKAKTMDVVDSAGRTVDISCLSRGTVEQLYLCLRLALAAVFAEQSVALPFLMDDVLVNLDPERAEAMAAVLARISLHHQLLFFTCHPHVVEMLARSASGARIVELATRSSSGSPFLAPPLRPVPAAGRSRPVA
jgi:DNA repair exonuclease SbcCD ATPase subunit